MNLYLNNVGIIKDSNIMLDGLTVITGKNNSGKTTVGKIMYSLLSAGTDLEESFESAKKEYIYSKLIEIERLFKFRRSVKFQDYKNGTSMGIPEIIAFRKYTKFSLSSLLDFFHDARSYIFELSPERYKYFFSKHENKYEKNGFIDSLSDNFDDLKKKAIEIFDTTLGVINEDNSYYNFIKDRTEAFLNHEFNREIKPVKYKRNTSTIELFDKEKCIVKAKVKTKNKVEFSHESSFLYPCTRCVFIDNPYIIDGLDKLAFLSHSFYKDFETNQELSIITCDDINDRDEILCSLFLKNTISNYFDDLEFQNQMSEIFQKINKIIPGEFEKTDDGYFYIDDGARLSVKNLATGSKMFLIIKKLLINRLIDRNTMLILDEPESHLHPEWINKFAEILVLLSHEINVRILLTTHSPNLLLALNYYTKKFSMSNKSHFYLAEKLNDGYFSSIRSIDNDIGEGYAHLSIPFVEINLKMKEIQKGN